MKERVNYKYLRTLLDKYYEAQTIPQEEEWLESIIIQDENLPEEFLVDRRVFKAIRESIEVPESLSDDIISRIKMEEQRKHLGKGNKRIYHRLSIGIISVSAAIIAFLIFIAPKTSFNNKDLNIQNSVLVTKNSNYNNGKEEILNEEIILKESDNIAKSNSTINNKKSKISYYHRKKSEKTVSSKPDNEKEESKILEFSEDEKRTILLGIKALEKAGQSWAVAREKTEAVDKAVDKTVENITNILN